MPATSKNPRPIADDQRLVCLIGFPGFYESRLSAITDYELDQIADNRVEDMSSARFYPETYVEPEIRPDRNDIGGIAWEFVDYDVTETAIAKDWLAFYADAFSRAAGFKVELEFDEIDSPREYNFGTDRLFARVGMPVLLDLFALSAADGHKALSALVEERFTSCSGFASHYPNDLAAWLEKPVSEWDHNEVGTLFDAVAALSDEEDIEETATECCEDSSNGGYLDNVDAFAWAKFDEAVAILIDHKREELPENHPLFKPDTRTFFPCAEQATFPFYAER